MRDNGDTGRTRWCHWTSSLTMRQVAKNCVPSISRWNTPRRTGAQPIRTPVNVLLAPAVATTKIKLQRHAARRPYQQTTMRKS